MPAKEPKQVVGVEDAQIEALKLDIETLKQKVLDEGFEKVRYKKERDELFKENELLNKLEGVIIEDQDGNVIEWEIDEGVVQIQLAEQPEPLEATWSDADLVDDTRTDMLMAMLPQVRIEFARHDAQRAEKAVDEIMKVWGLK